jgi:phosphatidylserine synthase
MVKTENQQRNNIFAQLTDKKMIEHNFKISDSVGVPSTLGAIILNLMSMFNISNINMLLTVVISTLSIVYLLISISIKYRELKKLRKGESNPS